MTEQLAAAAARLAEVLAVENAALAALDLPRAGAMLAAKTAAADALVAAGATLHEVVPAGARADALRRLSALIAENQRLLETAIKVQGRVIGVIARALKRGLRDQVAAPYGARGCATVPRPAAVAVSARA